MNDEQLIHLSVLVSLNRMMTGNYLDLCTIDSAMKALGRIPDGAAYTVLRQLHCVHWDKMPGELREAVPGLIERCLNIPVSQFQITPAARVELAPQKPWLVRLLSSGS